MLKANGVCGSGGGRGKQLQLKSRRPVFQPSSGTPLPLVPPAPPGCTHHPMCCKEKRPLREHSPFWAWGPDLPVYVRHCALCFEQIKPFTLILEGRHDSCPFYR